MNYLIIHEILKTQGSKAQLILSRQPTPLQQQAIGLVDSLRNSYNKSSVIYAEFSQNQFLFKQEYDKFNKIRNANKFYKFSVTTMNYLSQLITNIPLATGGYYLFCSYEDNGCLFDAIFLLRNTQGNIFKRSNNVFIVDKIEYLDIRELAMACRINVSKYQNNEEHYLSFIKVKQADISEYFFNWIAVDDTSKINSKECTARLFQILSQIDTPTDENGRKMDSVEFIGKVYEYIKSSNNKAVNIISLSRHFFNDDEKIIQFAESHNIMIDTEFNYDTSELSKFVKISVKADNILLTIVRKDLEEKVTISPDGNRIIINSPKFIEKFREAIANDDRGI